MFAILALAAAAATASPLLKEAVPTAPVQGWLAGDYPAEAGGATVRVLNFALTVSPQGSVVRCTVEGSTGSAALDARACMLLEQNGRFRPALDGAGNPAMGVWRGRVMWTTRGDTTDVPPLIEMAVALQTMPAGLRDPAYLDIAVSIDASGVADGCVSAVPLDLAGQPVPAKVAAGKILGPTACAEAIRTMKLEAARTAAGDAVPSVQTARVLFTAKAAELAASAPRPGDITVKAKREAKIVNTKGFARITDYQAIGNELVLVQAESGEWYRMELLPPCIGNSRLTKMSKDGAEIQVDQDMIQRLPRELRNALELQSGLVKVLPTGVIVDEGLGFTTHADGSIDRGIEVVATTIDGQDVIHIDSCRIRSMVPSDPPKGVKTKAKKK